MASAHLSTSLESRLDFLARPKIDFLKFKDRRSIYWVDKMPSKTHQSTVPAVTRRQEELAQPKRMHKNDRMSPTRPVSESALHAVPSARLEHLALAKSLSKEWKLHRPVQTVVSQGAKTASPSLRTVQLARPKRRNSTWMKEAGVIDQSTGDSRSVTDSTRELIAKAELLAEEDEATEDVSAPVAEVEPGQPKMLVYENMEFMEDVFLDTLDATAEPSLKEPEALYAQPQGGSS